MYNLKINRRVIILLAACLFVSCGPKIFYFHAEPCTVITIEDSIKFTWKVRGTPTLLHYQENADDPENPGVFYQYYKLVVKKGKKEIANPVMGITVVPDTSSSTIVINTKRRGDSAVAIGTRDSTEWGHHFYVDKIFSASGRRVTVTHLGKITELDSEGHPSLQFKDLQISGVWELRTLLTDSEKKDSTLVPGKLMIKAIIIHQ